MRDMLSIYNLGAGRQSTSQGFDYRSAETDSSEDRNEPVISLEDDFGKY